MNHANGRPDACFIALLIFHFVSVARDIARGFTATGVGSGTLQGLFSFGVGLFFSPGAVLYSTTTSTSLEYVKVGNALSALIL